MRAGCRVVLGFGEVQDEIYQARQVGLGSRNGLGVEPAARGVIGVVGHVRQVRPEPEPPRATDEVVARHERRPGRIIVPAA